MAVNDEDRYLMLSGLQHFQFCKRQWALIHIEQQWEENVRTIEGQHLHQKADQPFIKEKRRDKLIVRAMPIQSKELQLSGICDVVEFIQDSDGVELAGVEGTYKVYPVEYKRGKPKKGDEDVIQLAAQAMCLEEMMLCRVDTGYIFYNEIKHRIEVPISDMLRDQVRQMAAEMHHYYDKRHTPKVKTGPFCKNCSLQHICVPNLLQKRSVQSYIEGRLSE
ncbi:MAG: CRISPR-associated protein Cas4 [Paenibacillus macerans]|uniref:CRISPR-associated protein Cas4 n=1 Tax=Paenibacillus TaxID=44249 RepID=UPI00097A0C7B|nr:CRISPR-associated protein Cas4 [Paenibacillus macerans]MDU7477226.1 CRISPR-associated protein Cas4 [Paenibacillus macerans]MEC0329613.1 CRISPR-associated protein Cas4 [Paenibacillus macerans]OMG45367.1 CRISPR-associated protein Cas4 [Paenibacillus macerans]UMV50775.1 CRISPR-associated protein Cas4 [Paenibacillus macerans]